MKYVLLSSYLALAGTAQLGDRQGFVELEDRVEHLATACLVRL